MKEVLFCPYYLVPRIGFERPRYSAAEDNDDRTEVCVVVFSPPDLDREVVVTVQTRDGSAIGEDIVKK